MILDGVVVRSEISVEGLDLRELRRVSFYAIEPTRPRRVDGVESPRHRADAATEARRVDGVFDFHTGLDGVLIHSSLFSLLVGHDRALSNAIC